MLLLLLKTGPFEYYSVVTLEIRFSPVPTVCCYWLLKTAVVHLFSDFSKLRLQRLYSLLFVATEVSVLLSHWSASELTIISLNTWSQEEANK